MSYKIVVMKTDAVLNTYTTDVVDKVAQEIDQALDEDYTVAFTITTAEGTLVYLHRKTTDRERYGFNLDSLSKLYQT